MSTNADTDSLLDAARALSSSGRAHEAEAMYRDILESDPTNANAHYGIGRLLDHRGDEYGAIHAYRRALEHDPAYDAAYERLGRLYPNIAKNRGGNVALTL